ncbi:hypothetical protein AB6870_10550 [Rahnella inusitata]|uniref:hypothetical protein n=1 Tax=Rahnella inusitata TaxID=58169 RepID=UPI0039BE460C
MDHQIIPLEALVVTEATMISQNLYKRCFVLLKWSPFVLAAFTHFSYASSGHPILFSHSSLLISDGGNGGDGGPGEGGTGAMLDQAATAMAGDGGMTLTPLINTS